MIRVLIIFIPWLACAREMRGCRLQVRSLNGETTFEFSRVDRPRLSGLPCGLALALAEGPKRNVEPLDIENLPTASQGHAPVALALNRDDTVDYKLEETTILGEQWRRFREVGITKRMRGKDCVTEMKAEDVDKVVAQWEKGRANLSERCSSK